MHSAARRGCTPSARADVAARASSTGVAARGADHDHDAGQERDLRAHLVKSHAAQERLADALVEGSMVPRIYARKNGALVEAEAQLTAAIEVCERRSAYAALVGASLVKVVGGVKKINLIEAGEERRPWASGSTRSPSSSAAPWSATTCS